MFTGLIQKSGEVIRVESSRGMGKLAIKSSSWDSPLVVGESIAVNGVCLTLKSVRAEGMEFDVLQETFDRTNLGQKRKGSRVNLERALRMGDLVGGHFVTGHADGAGAVKALECAGRDWIMTVSCSEDLLKDMVLKGSIACDGVSLTISAIGGGSFRVNIIPHTWEITTFSTLSIGDAVNLETDMLGKYVRRAMGSRIEGSAITWNKLRESGFIG